MEKTECFVFGIRGNKYLFFFRLHTSIQPLELFGKALWNWPLFDVDHPFFLIVIDVAVFYAPLKLKLSRISTTIQYIHSTSKSELACALSMALTSAPHFQAYRAREDAHRRKIGQTRSPRHSAERHWNPSVAEILLPVLFPSRPVASEKK